MSEVNWTQVRRAAEEARIETSCMHGTSCHDVLCVERQARGECLATAAEALADLGPVLDALAKAWPGSKALDWPSPPGPPPAPSW